MMTSLNVEDLRDLQTFLSQSTLLYPYYIKFQEENISKELLLKADEAFLQTICEKFKMKLGEFGALRILIDAWKVENQPPTSTIRRNIRIDTNVSRPMSQLSSPISHDLSRRNQISDDVNPNTSGAVVMDNSRLSKPLIDNNVDLPSVPQETIEKGPKDEPEVIQYFDNTVNEFPIGKYNTFKFMI